MGEKFAHIINLSSFAYEVREKAVLVVKSTNTLLLTKWIPVKIWRRRHLKKKLKKFRRQKYQVPKKLMIHLTLLDPSRLLGETPASQVRT